MKSTATISIFYATFTLCFLLCAESNKFEAKLGDYPYQALLVKLDSNRHYCSGPIVGEKEILSTATCALDDFDKPLLPSAVNVVVGQISLNISAAIFKRQVVNITVHKDYRKEDGANNLALIELNEELVLDNHHISLVPLNRHSESAEKCVVTGWGLQDSDRTPLAVLTAEEVQLVDRKECQDIYKKNNILLSTDVVCASSKDTHNAQCTSDLGSPLVCGGYLMGISSPRIKCSLGPQLPSVYVNVPEHIDWVNNHMSKPQESKNSTKTKETTPGAASTFHMKVLSVVNFVLIYCLNKYVLM